MMLKVAICEKLVEVEVAESCLLAELELMLAQSVLLQFHHIWLNPTEMP